MVSGYFGIDFPLIRGIGKIDYLLLLGFHSSLGRALLIDPTWLMIKSLM